MSDRLASMVAETRAAAATIEHEWDRRALEWPLTRRSVVVEVGGYKGRWALQIAERYRPRLYVFEPQPWACEVCRAVLGERATVLNYGLADHKDGIRPMAAFETDGCSFERVNDGQAGAGELREIGAAFRALGIRRVDLMLMNIEGYEYRLLPHMLLRAKILPKRLMVQFHTFVDESGIALARIHQWIEELGYRVAWTYGVTLTAWERM